MPNSKSINNVVLFPIRTNTQPSTFQQTKPLFVSAKKPSQEENEWLIQLLSYEPTPCYALAEEKATETIRRVLRFAKVNNSGNRTVYPSIQRDVDLMCEFKHPIGLMLQDWLDGNRQFLPDDITSIAETSPHSGEVQS